MKIFLSTIAITLAFGANVNAEQDERLKDFTREYVVSKSNLTNVELGIQGWDPVSFFAEAPTRGLDSITENYGGVLYQFVNEENKQIFLENPAKYESTYGGWCAWAMSQGGKVPIKPEFYSFDLDENGEKVRVHFFLSQRALANFHNRRLVRRKSAFEILELMKAGDEISASILETARGFQEKADNHWFKILKDDK